MLSLLRKFSILHQSAGVLILYKRILFNRCSNSGCIIIKFKILDREIPLYLSIINGSCFNF